MDEGQGFPQPLTQSWSWSPQQNTACSYRGDVGRPIFATIATPDRAGQSRLFARSARDCHSDARLAILLLGASANRQSLAESFDLVISAEELAIGCLADMQFRYTIAELCFALKPWLIRHLLENFPTQPVYYFDSDIELFTPLVEVADALGHGASLVLTPHILQPTTDELSEQVLRRSGSFNAGFVAVAPTAPACAFVAWWCERVKTGCGNDHPEAAYGEQKWLELAPAICDGVVVLRHPGYNFAYWNAHERPLSCHDGSWNAAGWPLRFVHYSQWDLRTQDLEQYLRCHVGRDNQPLFELFGEYREKVHRAGLLAENFPSRVYGEVLTATGEPVPDLVRRAYQHHAASVDGVAADVFAHAVAVLNAPSSSRTELPDLPLTVLYDEIWQHCGDLRYPFDVGQREGRLAFLQWLVERGTVELALPAVFAAPARVALDRERVRQLELGEMPAALPPALTDPAVHSLPATSEALAGLIAARDQACAEILRRNADIRLLAGTNKALRRHLHALQVRRWRDEETIQALATELAQARRAGYAVWQRLNPPIEQLARLGTRQLRLLGNLLDVGRRRAKAAIPRQAVLGGSGPFFRRGFRLSDAAIVVGDTVRRNKKAPSGTLVYGPYVALPPGDYAVGVEARLHRSPPLMASFTLEVVCRDAQLVIGSRRSRLFASSGWRRVELAFTVPDGEAHRDFEARLWARQGIPLEIRGMELFRMLEMPTPGAARSAEATRA